MIGQGILDGNQSSNVAFMEVYGRYLLNGGTPQGFLELTPDEIQLMLIVMTAERERDRMKLLDGIAGMMGAKRI